MMLIWIVGLILLFLFASVLLVGAPYLPTLKPQVVEALSMLGLKPGQTLVELGSGDGKVLRAAAEKGIKAIGYELNPLLVVYSKVRHLRYRRLIRVHWGNFWLLPLPEADGIYTFLHTRFMKKLDKKIIQESTKPVKLVSYAFPVPGKKPKQESLGLFLYEYKPLASKPRLK